MSIIDCLVSNVAIATGLALVAALVGRVTLRPQITHALWVLVLVKLVTPPLIHIPVGYTTSESVDFEASANSNTDAMPEQMSATNEGPVGHDSEYATDVAHPSQVPSSTPMPNKRADTSNRFRSTSASEVSWTKVLVGLWVAGSIIWFLLAGTRLFRFKKVLRYARPASEDIRAKVSAIASRYGLHNIPRVLVADAKVPPIIWSFGRRTTMLLPGGLLSKLGTAERAGLLAHELAHLRRCDHWIRWFEFMVLGIYWWNPVAWWARAQVQQAEEECCDGWVLWAFPDKARLYAQTLVDTVEFLALAPQVKPDIATAFSQGNSLKRRIEMIIGARVSRRLSWRMRTALVLFALAVTPLSLLGSQGRVTDENTAARDTAPRVVASQPNEGATPSVPTEQTTKSQKSADITLIRGTVVDQQGKPIAGARLWYPYAFNKQSSKSLEVDARSDAEGRFALQIPPPTEQESARKFSRIWAHSPEYCLGNASPKSTKAKNGPAGIRLELAPATDTSLVVLDPDGRPMAGALVEPVNYLTHRGGGYALIPDGAKPFVAARTDAQGRVRLPAMARDGLSFVWVTTKAYGVQTQRFTVKAGEPAERTVQLRPVYRIEGRVIAEKPEWTAGIRLVFTTQKAWGPEGVKRPPWPTEGHADATTDKQGRFVVPIIAGDRLSMLQTVLNDKLPVRPDMPSPFIEFSAGKTTVLNIPMLPLIDIGGSILAKDTGQPLPGTKIHVYYGRYRQGTDVVSDARGRFSARVLPGRVRFQPMNLSETKYLQLGSPEWYNVPEDGFELPPIEVVSSKPLDGQLVDQDDSPVADARVIAYYANWLCSAATTGKDGRFILPKMPVSVAPDEATYRVELGIGETRFMRNGGVDTIQAAPFILRVKR